MKIDLRDVTILILVRLDSIDRLENILCVTEQFCRYFDTNLVVREADSHNNGILKSLLNRKIRYEFVEDKDPVLYKTRHFNQMTLSVGTPYMAIWDADIVVDKKAVMDCMDKLRKSEADIAYPYNGMCFAANNILRNFFLRQNNLKLLYKHRGKMALLYNFELVGGAVIMNKQKYMKAGGENEVHYGWGNDDFDRFYRFKGLAFNIYRYNFPLFHLEHPKMNNSFFNSSIQTNISVDARDNIKNSNKEELMEFCKKIKLQ